MSSRFWIDKLQLIPHPEGGYYRETYRCAQTLKAGRYDSGRNVSTAIFFLLESENKSHFHRIQSDELWFFHEGSALEILVFEENKLRKIYLGKNIEEGECLQAVIPARCWFGARMKEGKGFALVSCTVAPGFDFRDFELAKKDEMKQQFPKYAFLFDEMCIR
jgi:predicted cupin superfamily sugar epimerase